MAYTLYVRPLSHLSKEFIDRAFSEFGDVMDIHIPRTFKTKRRREFGYVKYHDKHAAARAIEALNGKSLNGHVMTVTWTDQTPKTPEQMAEKKKQRREEWLREHEHDGEPMSSEKNVRQTKDIPLSEMFFTAVDYPEGIGEEFTPIYQRNVPPVGQRRQFLSWVYVSPEQIERILKSELEKQAHIEGKRRRMAQD
jgi:RNA recognition motif-containing protein